MKLIAVVLWVIIAGGALYLANTTGVWPRTTCHSAAPFGPHDFECTYWIGR